MIERKCLIAIPQLSWILKLNHVKKNNQTWLVNKNNIIELNHVRKDSPNMVNRETTFNYYNSPVITMLEK